MMSVWRGGGEAEVMRGEAGPRLFCKGQERGINKTAAPSYEVAHGRARPAFSWACDQENQHQIYGKSSHVCGSLCFS